MANQQNRAQQEREARMGMLEASKAKDEQLTSYLKLENDSKKAEMQKYENNIIGSVKMAISKAKKDIKNEKDITIKQKKKEAIKKAKQLVKNNSKDDFSEIEKIFCAINNEKDKVAALWTYWDFDDETDDSDVQ